MDVADVAECGICTGNLEELGGAIELPCSCTVPYCQQCWDRTLAASLSKVGLPRCPSCRMVIRPDYDAQLGRLVFSRVADATVRYENWLESLDETLQQHGVSRCDEGTKFIARTQAGHLTKLFVMFAFQETDEVQGRLWQSLQRRKEEMNQEKWFTENEWFVTNQQGEEVSPPREPSEAEFPVQVRYPKTVERPVTELDASSFPLTLTFKEYVVSIDHRPAAGGAGNVASTFDFRESAEGSKCLVVVRDNVGAAKKWKDNSTSVCLHPGDRILEVNGYTEGSEILEQLGRAELLKVRLQQKGSIFKTDVFNPEDDMRNRLQSQAKPRQQELLRRRGEGDPPLCVCGGQLKLLELRERVKLLVDSDGFLEYAGRRFSVEDLIQMSAVSCDLCHRSIQEERPRLWTCQNGANTILHAQSYDVCEQCFNSCSEH